jgi:hypothetical protein
VQEFGACRRREGFEALAESRLLEGHVPTLCSASKPYDKDDADGQQGAGEPERDECLAPVRAVAHRLEDSDADAPRVDCPNERGDASKAERAERRRPGEGAPKHVATGRFKIPAHLSILSIGMSSPGPNPIEEAEASLEETSGVIDPPRSRSATRRKVRLLGAPVLADPVGPIEVGEHQDVGQLGAWSGAEARLGFTE